MPISLDDLWVGLPDAYKNEDTKVLISNLYAKKPAVFIKNKLPKSQDILSSLSISAADWQAAADLLERWRNALKILFSDLADTDGLIESPLFDLQSYADITGISLPGKTFIKGDHALPVAGTIKARGGVYEVLAFAEKTAIQGGLIKPGDDPVALLTATAKKYFGTFKISVGSTGNLGFSIGVMSCALGFDTTVHMSQDAKEWKKQRLRSYGVHVIEHAGDFATAVKAGREAIKNDPQGYFVDDENSKDLFLGYTVAALRIQKQLEQAAIKVDAEHPLFVYLACGVGGSPGGITWGLKMLYGDNVKCFFGEPVTSPAFLLRSLTGKPCTTYDYGLDNRTEADGLAVAQASEIVYEYVGDLVSGYFTVADDELFKILVKLKQATGIQIEPSAATSFLAPVRFSEQINVWDKYFPQYKKDQISHVFWTTGGSFVPAAEYQQFYEKGLALLADL